MSIFLQTTDPLCIKSEHAVSLNELAGCEDIILLLTWFPYKVVYVRNTQIISSNGQRDKDIIFLFFFLVAISS